MFIISLTGKNYKGFIFFLLLLYFGTLLIWTFIYNSHFVGVDTERCSLFKVDSAFCPIRVQSAATYNKHITQSAATYNKHITQSVSLIINRKCIPKSLIQREDNL